jgi:hypothetical protein
MNILYIHGFGSQFDPTHEKIVALATLGKVTGVNVDYCKGFESVFNKVRDVVSTDGIDLIVGTSMGGYMAAHVGAETGVPFVSINPAITPVSSLQKWMGTFADHNGNTKSLTESTIDSYPDIATTGYGLVLLDHNDEVIKAGDTVRLLEDKFHVEMFSGGNHRFAHMEQAMPLIATHVAQASASHGV